MLSSFSTALSGLNANAMSLSVIGNNLANLNTVGYKGSVAAFQDLLSRSVLSYNGAGNPMQIGLGVQPGSVSGNFSQGSLQTTGQATDAAIVGSGFFVVRGGQADYFTRAGNFTLDSEGRLMTQQGQYVQGYPVVNGKVDTNQALTDMQISTGTLSPASATSMTRLVSNLDSSMQPGESFTTAVQVVDSLGESHTVTATFTRNAGLPGDPPSFAFDLTTDGADVVGGTAGVPFSLLTGADAAAPPGTLDFDNAGILTSVDPGTGAISPPTDFSFTFPGLLDGAAAQSVSMDLVDDQGAGYISAFATPSATSSVFQDGVTAANLTTFSITEDGTIQGIYANGKTEPLGQLAIATFNNNQGLVRIGGNLFAQSFNSGEASIGVAGAGGRGNVSGSTLELANVDIAQEFTNLIVAQRGYQANSRMVTTTDELLQEAINLKR